VPNVIALFINLGEIRGGSVPRVTRMPDRQESSFLYLRRNAFFGYKNIQYYLAEGSFALNIIGLFIYPE
jgi:hypothetical protein